MPADTAFIVDDQAVIPEKEIIVNGLRIDLQPPPYSEVEEGPEYDNTFVTIELNNSTRLKGKLVQFDSSAESIRVLEARAVVPTEVGMASIKFMRLEKPYQITLNNSKSDKTHQGIDVETDARSFEVYFKDRTEITGKTYGSRSDKNGIHFYEQIKVGRKWRYCTHLFVSKTAI